jgi:two-component system NarL family sensor kinase
VNQITFREPVEAAIRTARRGEPDTLHLQDLERRRLARDLHDGPAQIMTGIALLVGQLSESETNPSRKERLMEALDLAEQCARDLRSISYGLHPPLLDELGLEGAVRAFANGFQQRTGIALDLNVEKGLRRFGSELEMAVFRILQEALSNVHRHSGSPAVTIVLEHDEKTLHLRVRDYGRGFAPGSNSGSGGLGLHSMRERARYLGGDVRIVSTAAGTKIDVSFPLEG